MNENERVVAHVDDLQDGEMLEVDIGQRSILLVRVDGEYHALASHCTHYGAPLAKGVLSGHHVVCPWHQTYFDIVTGKMEEPPGLNAVQHFETRIEGDEVIITIPEDVLDGWVMPMARYNRDADGRVFVILGGGAAGSMAAETLRQDGYQGRIVIVTKENHVPYDRPHLSKGYFRERANPHPPNLRSPRFYMDHDIEILFEREVVRLDPASKTLEFADFPAMSFDAVLVATGGEPRTLNVPGSDLENVFTLRSFDDAYRLAEAVDRSHRIVIVGAGFIATEVASSLSERGMDVTVVAHEMELFGDVFGNQIGGMFREMHEQRLVRFELGTEVERFEGDGAVRRVILKNGESLDTDLVLTAIGISPATGFIPEANKNTDGSVNVDEYLRFAPNCYAAGDIARFADSRTGESSRIEHWRLALQQGRCAAHNMAGQASAFQAVPFFWTHQLGLSLQMVGRAQSWDDIIFQGSPADRDFIAFYVKDGEVRAAAGMNQHARIGAVAELMRRNQMPSADELRQGSIDLVEQLKPVYAGK
jgi:NADPH-dependent 2,4-dienoyl-CoA reductase/sulfur reductase-like enzyme/nitrite reductase/ring-hydroxylating ferredoxin subunit